MEAFCGDHARVKELTTERTSLKAGSEHVKEEHGTSDTCGNERELAVVMRNGQLIVLVQTVWSLRGRAEAGE